MAIDTVNYRPHPKDGGRLYFHFVCQSTPSTGTAMRERATRRAVCLLRSRMRTFLFVFIFNQEKITFFFLLKVVNQVHLMHVAFL